MTVGATVGKASSRVIGTLLGLVVAIVLASLTAGHTLAALAEILTRILLAFYLVKPSPLSLIVRMPAAGESYYAGTRCADITRSPADHQQQPFQRLCKPVCC